MTYKNQTTANPLLYNITLKINENLAKDWLHEMKERYLPAITDGKIIVFSQINELLIEQEDEDLTFAVQFIFATKAIYDTDGLQSLGQFLKLLDEAYLGKYVYFTTKMEILHSYSRPSHN